MWKYQYDNEYFEAVEDEVFMQFLEYEEEEAFAHSLKYGKH